jgi:outer membrane protein assembly factor BamA
VGLLVVLAWLLASAPSSAVAAPAPTASDPEATSAFVPDAESETEPESEPESETEPESEPEPDAEPEPGSDAEPEPGSDAESEPGSDADMAAWSDDEGAVDLTDPMGPIEAALDGLVAQGIGVTNRARQTSALQGEMLTARIAAPDTRLMQYVLERVADDGYQILLSPIARDTFDLVAMRVGPNQGRGVALVQVERTKVEGNFRKGEDRETLREMVSLPGGGVVPLWVTEQLRSVGYEISFRADGPGSIVIEVQPGRAIRRIRVRDYVPLSERDVRRVLSPAARPGSLARGRCTTKRLATRDPSASICASDDLACQQWERDEIRRLERFLFDQGYLRGKAGLGLVCGRGDDAADLWVLLDKGRPFRTQSMTVTGNVSTPDQRWIRRVFKPTVGPFRLIPKRISRKHVDDAKERVAQEYAQPRTGRGGSRRALQLPYPGVRIDTNFDLMTPADVPAKGNKLPLEIDIQLGNGVRTAFLGNERIGDNRLRKQLQLFKRQEPATNNVARREAAQLRNFYQTRGFLLAEVDGRFQDFGTLKQLTFVIDEGPRMKVRSVALDRPPQVPKPVWDEIEREYRRRRNVKKRGRFADAQARQDLGVLLTSLAERGYLCAHARMRVALWKDGLDQEGAHAVLDPLTAVDALSEPSWLLEQLDAAGLAGARKRRSGGLFVRVEVVPGPRVVTSGRESVQHLEVEIPPTRQVRHLPTTTEGAWGAPRILRDGPLRRAGDERAGGIPVSLTLERDAERAIARSYRAGGFPLADAEIRFLYTDRQGRAHRVAHAERLTDPEVGLCSENRERSVATVDIEVNAYEGRRGRFGKTLVRGNFKTRPYVVRREIVFEEGDEYTVTAVDRSRKGIEGTGVAEAVEIRSQPNGCELTDDPDQECVVHHVVSMVEAKDRAMDVAWGFGGRTLDPFYLFLRPGFPNVFGTGWDLALEGHVGLNPPGLRDVFCDGEDCYERRARVSLSRPRIFGSPLTFEISGQAQRWVTPFRGRIDSALGQVRLTWPINENLRTYFGYLIQAANMSKDVVKPTLGPQTPCQGRPELACQPPNRAESIVPDLTGGLQTGAVWQRVDNPFSPEDGFIATADALFASPWLGGNDWWFRGDLMWQHFIPLPGFDRRLNFRYSLVYGHMVPFANLPGAHTTSVPEVWRYFGGGVVELGIRGIAPQTMLVDIEELTTSHGVDILRPTPQGGHIRALGTLALQVTSVREFLGGKLDHSIFFDFGVLTQRWRHVQFQRDFRRSMGINFVKWVSRVVTVSLGYAWLIPDSIWPGNVRPTDDRTGRFVFDVGATF